MMLRLRCDPLRKALKGKQIDRYEIFAQDVMYQGDVNGQSAATGSRPTIL
jgi:hypothetical protein